jgi:SOS-response transcriptional repressor LexA
VAGSWVTEMPNDAMRLTAARGDLILCMPVGDLRDRKVYAFLLDGRPLIRAVELKADGLALVAENTAIDPITPTPEQLKQLTPIGLVVGSVKFHAV